MIDKAMINKLDVDTAKITYATIENLDVTKQRVEEIYGEYGEFQKLVVTDFSAANGRIDVLDSNYANIKNLLSGSAGIGDLQNIHLTSDNAVIDTALVRTAVMQSVTIGDLLAGTISTNKFKIASDDGGIQISGATQQWKDANGVVRMQAGKDAQGNFTFALFDETGKGTLIDATGVKSEAIADGLIVNSMVSESANIAAAKLDIDSLFTEINNSSKVIKSNRIWLDDSNQSLNQAYTKMSQNITQIGDTASSASDSASAAADAAKKALETLSGISTLDAMSASLNNDAHVVHTYTDGTGGDYSSCYTVFSVFLGDTDVSDHIDEIKAVASDGITGIWNPQTRKYQVTAMSTDNGYVDISALYGLEGKVLLVGGKGLVIGGKTMIVKSIIYGEKGKKERRVYLTDDCAYHLHKYLLSRDDTNPALFVSNKRPHTRLGKQAIQSMLRTLGQKTEIHAHPHKFRRTLLTDAGNRGIPLQEIQMYAGHQKPDTTMMYVTVSEENVRASFRRYIA